MNGTFCNCKSLISLNLNNFIATNTEYMFYECNSLINLNLSNFITSNVTNMRFMFYGCTNLLWNYIHKT
jgi:surface protein